MIRGYKTSDQANLQVVLINTDSSRKYFNEYYKKVPWVALPYSGDNPKQLRWYYQQLIGALNVTEQPTIVALDGRTGNIIDPNARDTLSRNRFNFAECLRDWGFANE